MAPPDTKVTQSTQLSNLIRVIRGPSTGTADNSHLHKKFTQALRVASTSRVNQFAIRDRLAGLEERWRISSEDEVADALAGRLKDLYALEDARKYLYIPECLQLLLSLSSGQPNYDFEYELAGARLEALELRNAGLAKVEIVDDSALWATIDYTADDSEDEGVYATQSLAQIRELVEDEVDRRSSDGDLSNDDLYVDLEDDDALDDVKITHELLGKIRRGSYQQLSEATILRESIHMLHGLPTPLFDIMPSSQVFAVPAAVSLNAVSSEALEGLMNRFAALGSKVVPLRTWARSEEQSPTMRRFQAVVNDMLSTFLLELQAAERDIVDQDQESPTLIRVLSAIENSIKSIEVLGSCLPALKGHNREVKLLDNIVQRIEEQEGLGMQTEELVLAFITCFEIYWRPVELWLRGANITCDGITFVHAAAEQDLPLDGLWRGLFDFTCNEDGLFDAPEFLREYVSQLMTIGKTAYMLDKLEQQESIQEVKFPSEWMRTGLLKDRHPFEPITNALTRSIDRRIQWSQGLSQALLNHLREQWNFRETILATELVYLARIGSNNDRAYSALFRLIDRSQHHEWQDQHVLTGILQDAFTGTEYVHTSQLTASFVPTDRSNGSRSRSLVQLEAIKLNLVLSWPLANIIDAGAISVLQRVAVFLMQVARAKDVLDQYTTRFDPYLITDAATRRIVMALQQRLRWFANTLHSYLAFDILSSASLGLAASSAGAADVDTVIRQFRSAIESLERGCFLNENLASSHQAIVSILDLAVVLSDHCLRDRGKQHDERLDKLDLVDDSDEDSDGSVRDRSDFVGRSLSLDPDSAKLRELSATFHQLLVFVHGGVREASRIESDKRLELFADDLALELNSLKWAR